MQIVLSTLEPDWTWHYKSELTTIYINIEKYPRRGYIQLAKSINGLILKEIICIELSKNNLFQDRLCEDCPCIVEKIRNKLF